MFLSVHSISGSTRKYPSTFAGVQFVSSVMEKWSPAPKMDARLQQTNEQIGETDDPTEYS